jgi:hypothetical protein
MWLQLALLTGCALFAGLSAWFAVMANRAYAACQHSEARLLQQRGRIVGLEGAVENLNAKHRKLAGRIYADEQHGNLPAPAATAAVAGDVCENYARAQIDGPTSAAAQCVCEFCEAKRAERAQFRAAAVPKRGNVGRVNGR